MKKLSAAEQRFLDNATLIAALQLIFQSLKNSECPIFRIDEIAETTSGGTPNRTVTAFYGGEIPWIKSGELNDGLIENAEEYITEQGLKNSSTKIYPKGTLVIALYGATVGKIGILGIDAASNQAVCAVTLKNAEVSKNFLFWFFRHKRQDFLKDSFGGAQPNISQKILRETLVPIPPLEIQEKICLFMEIAEKRQRGNKHLELPSLPPPLDEQRRIVARIEELAAKVEEARGLRRQSAEEAEVLLSNSSGSIFEELKKQEGFQLLGNISLKITDGEHATPIRCESGHYLLSARNIQNNKIDLKIVDYVDNGEFFRIQQRCNPSEGDVLISCSGTIGKIALVDKSDAYVMVRSVAMVRPNPQILDSQYLAHALRSRLLQEQMIEKSKASAQANLFLGKIKSLQIPLPPLPEQYRIVAYLDDLQSKVDALKRLQAETAAELDALLPSILDKAFKGGTVKP